MSNLSYWERRKATEMFRYMEEAEAVSDEIAQLYLKSSRYISHELDVIFDKYKSKHHLSDAEARKLLSKISESSSIIDLKNVLRAETDDPLKATILAELEGPAYQARLERLQQLQNQLDYTMQHVYQQEKIKNTSHYVDLANEAYYRSIFDIQRRTGLGFGFNLLEPKVIDRVINSKWSGVNYSSRIWSNTRALAQDIKQELLINLVTGRTDREVAEIISNKFAAGASQARRLVRTESCNLANQMEMLSYEECGISYYRYVATLDLKTSSVCRKLDGKTFPVSEQQPGINCPPMHPWCRSTTICDISEKELAQMQRRARDPVSGKTITIPANTTYEQWYGQYVKNNPKAALNEKMVQNRSSDRAQYKRYADVLGKEYVPKSIDDFQKLKYGPGDDYGILKAQVKGMSYYNKALQSEPEITKIVKSIAERGGLDIAGFEYRIKGKDSYLRKIKSNYNSSGNAYEVKDIIRYTYISDPQNLVEKTLKSIEAYQKEGYNTIEIKNYWTNRRNPYNGINTTLKASDGQKFELQYHTQESYAVKDAMHKDYEEWRILDPASKDAIELRKKMIRQSENMQVPDGIERVK